MQNKTEQNYDSTVQNKIEQNHDSLSDRYFIDRPHSIRLSRSLLSLRAPRLWPASPAARVSRWARGVWQLASTPQLEALRRDVAELQASAPLILRSVHTSWGKLRAASEQARQVRAPHLLVAIYVPGGQKCLVHFI